MRNFLQWRKISSATSNYSTFQRAEIIRFYWFRNRANLTDIKIFYLLQVLVQVLVQGGGGNFYLIKRVGLFSI